jgi:hypothetical protein
VTVQVSSDYERFIREWDPPGRLQTIRDFRVIPAQPMSGCVTIAVKMSLLGRVGSWLYGEDLLDELERALQEAAPIGADVLVVPWNASDSAWRDGALS